MLGLKLDSDRYQTVNFNVFPENHQAFRVFTACSNQWIVVPGFKKPTLQGISLPAIVAVMQAYGVTDTADCLDRVQLIESGALEVLNKQ